MNCLFYKMSANVHCSNYWHSKWFLYEQKRWANACMLYIPCRFCSIIMYCFPWSRRTASDDYDCPQTGKQHVVYSIALDYYLVCPASNCRPDVKIIDCTVLYCRVINKETQEVWHIMSEQSVLSRVINCEFIKQQMKI